VVHASVHTMAYNHAIGTQKTASKRIQHAETEFHVYALEWTAQKITAFIDGEAYFTFENDGKGDIDTWPFNKPFYLKLNLAWGGNWAVHKVSTKRLSLLFTRSIMSGFINNQV